LIVVESLVDLQPQPAGHPMADFQPQCWAQEFPIAPVNFPGISADF
jgi:hypothetical protein